MDNRPIGVFDSGFGGLTAVRRMQEMMPDERIIYFGDTGRVPYGTRSAETIIKYTRQDIAFLRSFDIKAIIVACGTVSSVALNTVADEIHLPIFGVVEPACARALHETKTGRIGVLGTSGTIRSGAYERCLHQQQAGLQVFARACPLFVPLVENGRVTPGDIVIETVAQEYLADLKADRVDTLILGCTHFPLLREVIAGIMGPEVALIDSGAEAADYARTQVEPGMGPGGAQYFVSDDPAPFVEYASLFLQEAPLCGATQIDIAAYEKVDTTNNRG